jgi:hypothetical protein
MDLLRRIRWANVARVLAVLAAVALVIAWPRLRSDPPPLPPATTFAQEPAPPADIADEPRSAVTPRTRKRAATRPRVPSRARAERRKRASNGSARKGEWPKRIPTPRAAVETSPVRPPVAVAPAPISPPPVASAPAWTPPPVTEFGFE